MGLRTGCVWAVLVLSCACARTPRGSTAVTPTGKQDQILLGPRTLFIETTGKLQPDGSGELLHLLRLGGELTHLVPAPDVTPGEEENPILVLGRMLLEVSLLELIDRPPAKTPGEVALRFKQTRQGFAFDGDLRMVTILRGIDQGMVVAVVPVTPEAQLAAEKGGPEALLAGHIGQTRFEHRFSLQIPDGFRVRELPAPVKVEVEGMALERRLEVDALLATVRGLSRLEIGAMGIPGQRVGQLMGQLKPVDREPPRIKLEMVAETLTSTGRLGAALKETRRLVDEHPQEGFYRVKQAQVFLGAGLVELAREEARRAVELAPKLAHSHQILALILENDLLGRHWGPGYDRAAAMEVRRQELVLTGPEGRGNRDLALLLARDERGRLLESDAPLSEILDLTASSGMFVETMSELRAQVLLRSGRGSDAEAVIREHLSDEAHRHYLLAAIAQARGADAALDQLPGMSLAGATGATPLMQAAQLLIQARTFPVAGALARAAAGLDPRMQHTADGMGRLVRAEDRKPESNPALEALRRLQVACISPGAFQKAVPALMDARAKERAVFEREVPDDPFQRICRGVLLTATWPASRWEVDVALATDMDVAGDAATGYRVRHRVPPPGTFIPAATYFFTVHGGAPRFLGAGPYVAADEALRLAEAGRLKPAATWLSWVREFVPGTMGPRRPSPTARAFDVLWAGQPELAGPLRDTAAAIAAFSPEKAPRAIPALERALAARPAVERQRVLATALMAAQMSTDRPKDAARTADLLNQPGPGDDALVGARAMAAAAAGNCPKALAAVQAEWKREPNAESAGSVASVAMACGRSEEGVEFARKATTLDGAVPANFNNLAWYLAMSGKPGTEALAAARRAVQATSRRSPSQLHTLALVAAQVGELSESRAALLDALGRVPAGTEPLAEDAAWLVVGATAESLGVPDQAIKAYRKVRKNAPLQLASTSDWTLAQARLRALEPNRTTRP